MNLTDLPTLNAAFNLLSTIFLLFGYVYIKRGMRETHKKFMLAALISSAIFLTSYLIYHAKVGSVPYPHQNWTRYFYFTILIPHIILAAVMVPAILIALWHALRDQFDKHKRLVRWVWPVWMYVSLSGVIIYLMLYQL
jgi:uncharacterized membrane protein YozB (DUF420 family)